MAQELNSMPLKLEFPVYSEYAQATYYNLVYVGEGKLLLEDKFLYENILEDAKKWSDCTFQSTDKAYRKLVESRQRMEQNNSLEMPQSVQANPMESGLQNINLNADNKCVDNKNDSWQTNLLTEPNHTQLQTTGFDGCIKKWNAKVFYLPLLQQGMFF